MVIFLYFGIISGILLILFMYFLDNIKMRLKRVAPKDKAKYLKHKLPIRIFIACLMVIFIANIVPEIIWLVGEKEKTIGNKVIDSATLDLLPDVSGDYYLGKEIADNENIYVFKLLGTQYSAMEKRLVVDTDTVILGYGEQPKYENIQVYNRVRLKINKTSLKGLGSKISSFLLSQVNDIFVDNSGWKEYSNNKKTKLFIPKDSIMENYGGQTK
ncbi:MAG TPA: hypothetical protein VIK72_11420 [Clostridiaceae bacterium]